MKQAVILSLLLAYAPSMAQAQVKVSQTATQVTIENQYLSRTFNITGNRLTPGVLVNKRAAGATFTPGQGSEEFALNPQARQHTLVSRKGWKAEADAWCNESGLSLRASISFCRSICRIRTP